MLPDFPVAAERVEFGVGRVQGGAQPIEIGGSLVFLNAYAPLASDYKFVFLPPMEVREHVADLNDKEGLKAFSEKVRRLMQEALDKEAESRPGLAQVRALQDMYGD